MKRGVRAACLVAFAPLAPLAYAGAYEDCVTAGNQAAVMQCLVNQEKDANTELANAEAFYFPFSEPDTGLWLVPDSGFAKVRLDGVGDVQLY